MKKLLTILFIGVISLKAQLDTIPMKGSMTHTSGAPLTISSSKVIYTNWDNIIYPHYELQQKFDTVKVKILYEQGESIVPMILRGWQVRQFSKWIKGDSVFWDSYGYHDYPDKWEPLQIFLFDDKKSRIDTVRIWNVKIKSW